MNIKLDIIYLATLFRWLFYCLYLLFLLYYIKYKFDLWELQIESKS